MAIPADILNDMKIKIELANLIEMCQNRKLITPTERVAYILTLNGSVHSEIDKLLALLPPETP